MTSTSACWSRSHLTAQSRQAPDAVSGNGCPRRCSSRMRERPAPARLKVAASYYASGFEDKPRLILDLVNGGNAGVTLTATSNHYSDDEPQSIHVRAQGNGTHEIDAVATAHGCYDLTVTASSHPTWSQRFIGHIDNGEDSVTGSF